MTRVIFAAVAALASLTFDPSHTLPKIQRFKLTQCRGGTLDPPMSALGQKQTCAAQKVMSCFGSIADIAAYRLRRIPIAALAEH
jgi:hypothetical protein